METENRPKKRVYSEKSASEGSEDDDYVPYVPVKIRKQQMLQKVMRLRGKGLTEEEQKDSGGEQKDEDEGLGPRSNVSLLDQHQHPQGESRRSSHTRLCSSVRN
ncbi:probable ATP-dependent RNA helicase DDX41 [Danio aesculapii]|uniref:probable ATP-dependent RNA helicase DDX41 n=1 Tax=Danio aesculapii TaxID=1142201 RepID=UPI0024C076BB|nr:probable ATP-dependent RNA helicase DDX41 [Danio aesculapii]